jgi:predicted transcriptional regulator
MDAHNEDICNMRLREIINVTEAHVFSSRIDLDCDIRSAFASDLMSDVLYHDVAHGILITGLTNPQMIRTAEIAEVSAVLMVRGKVPMPETLELAEELGIPLIGTRSIMFETCGRLYAAGLPACAWRGN